MQNKQNTILKPILKYVHCLSNLQHIYLRYIILNNQAALLLIKHY